MVLKSSIQEKKTTVYYLAHH